MPRLHSPSGGRPGDAVGAAGAVAGAVGGIVGPGQEPWQHRGVQKVQGLLRKEPKLDRLKHQIMRKS